MKLGKNEREVALTLTDDEKEWRVYTDSARLTGRLRKVAEAWGVTPERVGSHGWEFPLPLRAVRFGGPRTPRKVSEAGREALARARAHRQSAKIGANGLVISRPSEGRA